MLNQESLMLLDIDFDLHYCILIEEKATRTFTLKYLLVISDILDEEAVVRIESIIKTNTTKEDFVNSLVSDLSACILKQLLIAESKYEKANLGTLYDYCLNAFKNKFLTVTSFAEDADYKYYDVFDSRNIIFSLFFNTNVNNIQGLNSVDYTKNIVLKSNFFLYCLINNSKIIDTDVDLNALCQRHKLQVMGMTTSSMLKLLTDLTKQHLKVFDLYENEILERKTIYEYSYYIYDIDESLKLKSTVKCPELFQTFLNFNKEFVKPPYIDKYTYWVDKQAIDSFFIDLPYLLSQHNKTEITETILD